MNDSAVGLILLIMRRFALVFSFMYTVAVMSASAVAVAAPLPASAAVVGSTAGAQDASAVESSLGLDRPARRLIQRGLNNEGFDAGAADGLFGPRTRAALRRWQEARGFPATGYLNGGQVELLRAAALPPVPPVATVDPVDPPAAPVEPTAPPDPAGGGVPAATEAAASTAELPRTAGEVGSPPSQVAGTAAPTAGLPLTPGSGPDCDAWNTEEFFENAAVGIVRACLASGADPIVLDDDGNSPLHLAARSSPDPLVIEALLGAGADLRAPTASGLTALHVAAVDNENPAVLAALLAAGAGVNVRDTGELGTTPLHQSVVNPNPEVFEHLLAAGADPAAGMTYPQGFFQGLRFCTWLRCTPRPLP